MSFASARSVGQPDRSETASSHAPGTIPETPQAEARTRQEAKHASLRARVCRTRGCHRWVSTDLVVVDLDGSTLHPEDVIQGSKGYRWLSPDYFIWLEKRFSGFQRKMQVAGREDQYTQAFAGRYAAIRDAAQALYTSEDFETARRRMAELPMESPNRSTGILFQRSRFDYPPDSDLPVLRPVTFHALGEVDAIRNQALSLGWTDAQLYGTRGRFTFPCGPGYGVVCFIHSDQRLRKVASAHIEIICSGGHSLHFYRKEVSQ